MADYTFRMASIDDKKSVYDVLVASYFLDMPLFEACNMTEPPNIDVWPVIQELKSNLSVVALDKNGQIIGVSINIVPKDNGDEVVGLPEPIERFFNTVDADSNGLLLNLEKTTMELRLLTVVREHRGKGVSKRLIEETETVAKRIGREKIFAIATGAFMEAAFRRQKWDSVYTYFYASHTKVDPSFKIPSLPHDSITIFEKEIN